MIKDKLYFIPEKLEHDDVVLFEGTEKRSIANKKQDADWWISLRYVTSCQKSFQLEVTTFKKVLNEDFFDEFIRLVEKHTNSNQNK